MGRKIALLIGNSEYNDTRLSQLKAPAADVNALADLLLAREIGGFDDVKILLNRPFDEVQTRIEDVFADSQPDDLILLYFSGHGVKDEHNQLYLALTETRSQKPRALSISSSFLKDVMDGARARLQVLILDCCYSGAFASGMKGALGAPVLTNATFGDESHSRGRVVLAATNTTQYAWEGNQVLGEAVENSLFTHYLIEALRTGAADEDNDGWVTPNDLHAYISRQVAPHQHPRLFALAQEGDIYLARNPCPPALPPDLQQALTSSDKYMLLGAITELGQLLHNPDAKLASAARHRLNSLRVDTTQPRYVYDKVMMVLEQEHPPTASLPQAKAPELQPQKQAEKKAPREHIAALRRRAQAFLVWLGSGPLRQVVIGAGIVLLSALVIFGGKTIAGNLAQTAQAKATQTALAVAGMPATTPDFKGTGPGLTQTQPASAPITSVTAAPLVAVTVAAPVNAGGALSATVNLVSQMGGVSNAIAIQDTTAYLGEGPRLSILDLSDLTHPTRIAQTPVLSNVIQKIAVSQTTVYAVVGDKRISIIDVADPKNPKVLASYDDPSNTINDIAVEGSLVFVVDNGLRIIDVSNPAKPADVGFFDVGGKTTEIAVKIKGNYAYLISSYDGGLYVVDISDPKNPKQIGYVGFGAEPGTQASAIDIVDNRAYVSGSKYWVIDISKPANPTIVIGGPSTYAQVLAVNGSFLYLLTEALVQVVDIHHPTDPISTGSFSVRACDMVVRESKVFVAECMGGMRVVDVSNTAKPTEVGAYGSGAFGMVTAAGSRQSNDIAMAVSGKYAYIAMDYYFKVVDISDPLHPQVIGILNDMPAYERQVAVAGNYAYILTFASGVQVVDISDPMKPTLVKALPLPQYSGSFVMGNGYLYETSNNLDKDNVSGMRVIDITDPENIAVVGTLLFDDKVYHDAVSGQFGYVAAQDKIHVVDISNPANPTVVASQSRKVSGITIRQNYAYVMNSEGLNVLDISDTQDIWRVGLCSAQDCGFDSDMIVIDGNYALIGKTDYGGALTLADISEPTAPFKIASLMQAIGYNGRFSKSAIALAGNTIYQVSAEDGLFILSISK